VPYYDPRIVPAHGNPEATVFLINEAPGPREAYYRIPSVGAQGGNIYCALRKAKVKWATDFPMFSWPRLIRECYKSPDKKLEAFELRDKFLAIRATYIKCSNAFHLWPRSSPQVCDFVDPSRDDVLSASNLDRLRKEVPEKHRVLLICGEFAWLACHGTALLEPAKHEGNPLSFEELQVVNCRLRSSFTNGWYMGHTQRWSLNSSRTSTILTNVSQVAQWML